MLGIRRREFVTLLGVREEGQLGDDFGVERRPG
jgi:hypothetical protein